MAKQITEITKRDLREMLENVDWWGHLEEPEFLSGIQGMNKTVSAVADEVFIALLKQQLTSLDVQIRGRHGETVRLFLPHEARS